MIDLEDGFIEINKPLSIKDTISLDDLSMSSSQKFGLGTLETVSDVSIEKLFERAQSHNGRVRTIVRYTPANMEVIKGAKRLLFVVVHGTFATDSEHYYDSKTKNFNNMLNYAAQIAKEKGMQADILSYQWNGENSNDSRISAGKRLGTLLDVISKNYSYITTIAHSHGCNVTNAAINEMVHTIIDVVIHLSSPVMEQFFWGYEPDPKKFKELYSFYSLHDIVQWGGSWNFIQWGSLWDWVPFSGSKTVDVKALRDKGYIIDGRRYTGKNVVNILFAYDNQLPGHSEQVTLVMQDLKAIIEKIKKYYPHQNDLSINIVPEEKSGKYKVDHINISLLPVNTQEEFLQYRAKLPGKMTQYSSDQRQEHKTVYGMDKDGPEYSIARILQLLSKALN